MWSTSRYLQSCQISSRRKRFCAIGDAIADNFTTSLQSKAMLCHHPEERVRLVFLGVDYLTNFIGEIRYRIGETIHVYVVESFISKRGGYKKTIELKGHGAHDAAIHLTNDPSAHSHWERCEMHNKEWYCPSHTCRVRLITEPTCDNCLRTKPFTLMESRDIWSTTYIPGPWNRWDIVCSSVSKNDVVMARKLEELKSKVGEDGGRVWALDYREGGKKFFLWSRGAHTFVDLYLQIPCNERHAYEVILPSTPCHMVYDLDMSIEGCLNADKDHKQMVKDIGESSRGC